jgi:hypothetical protein
MSTRNRIDRYSRYVYSALAVLTATLTGLLVHASLGVQVIA